MENTGSLSQSKAKSVWVTCPICGENDMQQTSDKEGNTLISCVNHDCGSNGGTNFSKIQTKYAPQSDALPAILAIKPMASAPRPKDGEYVHLLVLDEWTEGGQISRAWNLVYWLDAFDGRPAGWYGNNCGDLRNPQGWILSTAELPLVNFTPTI